MSDGENTLEDEIYDDNAHDDNAHNDLSDSEDERDQDNEIIEYGSDEKVTSCVIIFI